MTTVSKPKRKPARADVSDQRKMSSVILFAASPGPTPGSVRSSIVFMGVITFLYRARSIRADHSQFSAESSLNGVSSHEATAGSGIASTVTGTSRGILISFASAQFKITVPSESSSTTTFLVLPVPEMFKSLRRVACPAAQ